MFSSKTAGQKILTSNDREDTKVSSLYVDYSTLPSAQLAGAVEYANSISAEG